MTRSDLLAPAWSATGAEELVDDRALLAAMVRTEVALAVAQERLGMIPAGAGAAVARAASPDALDLDGLAAGLRDTANPVVAFVGQLGAAVAEKDPAAAEYVHRGGTSQDVLDTALMLLCGDVLDVVDARLGECAERLADLAARHRDTPMAARTLTQHAVPTTFGLKAALWRHGVCDARRRVAAVRDALPVSLGGAAGTLAAYHEYGLLERGGEEPDAVRATLALPGFVARELDLRDQEAPWHAVRTPVADVAGALLAALGALGKVAADVLVLSRTEIGEVVEDPDAGRGASSAMPQKANPVLATLVATAARQLPAQTAVLFASMAAEDERSAGGWHAEWQALREGLRLTAGAATNATALVEALRVHPDRMAANLGLTRGAIASERLGARLTSALGKAEAKRLLGAAAHEAARSGRDLADVVADELRTRDVAGTAVASVADALDPATYLGVAPSLVDRLLAAPSPSVAPRFEE